MSTENTLFNANQLATITILGLSFGALLLGRFSQGTFRTRFKKFIASRSFTIALFLSGLLLAAMLDVFSGDIRKKIEGAAPTLTADGIIWLVISSFVFFTVIGWLREHYSWGERQEDQNRIKTAFDILTESPPVGFVNSFQANYKSAVENTLSFLNKDSKTLDDASEAACIVVGHILKLVHEWDLNKKANYHASISIYFDKESVLLPDENLDILKFKHQDTRLNNLAGVLFIPNNLFVKMVPGKEPNIFDESELIDSFLLPVRDISRDLWQSPADKGEPNLPGAPTALVTGFEMVPDTHLLHEKCKSRFSESVVIQLKDFFEHHDQDYMRSFICMAIPVTGGRHPLGVVSIGSSDCNLLGSEKKGLSFYQLVTPFLYQLGLICEKSVDFYLDPAKTESEEEVK